MLYHFMTTMNYFSWSNALPLFYVNPSILLHFLNSITVFLVITLSTHLREGDILFLVWIPLASALALAWHFLTFLSCLVNHWLDAYQIFMDIQKLGHNKELIEFWWPWPNFQDHSSRKMKFLWKKINKVEMADFSLSANWDSCFDCMES